MKGLGKVEIIPTNILFPFISLYALGETSTTQSVRYILRLPHLNSGLMSSVEHIESS